MTKPNPITLLTSLAVTTFPTFVHGMGSANVPIFMPSGDAVLDMLTQFADMSATSTSEFQSVISGLGSDPEFTSLAHTEAELDPMFMFSSGGGSRQSFDLLIASLLSSAWRQLLALEAAPTEEAFVRAVISNYEELRRALRGEQVRTYNLIGFAGVQLPQDAQLALPWGVMRNAPEAKTQMPWPYRYPKLQTSLLLMNPRLTSVSISRASQPESTPPTQDELDEQRKMHTLIPLAFALTTVHEEIPRAPIWTFELTLQPFTSGTSYGTAMGAGNIFIPKLELTTPQLREVEECARLMNKRHDENLDIAARRVISAMSQRLDKTDSLIDAVTAWESMVGTRSETVFRVTAALANLLEADPSKRATYRKRLGAIYDTRSRVVHGDVVPFDDINTQADAAIKIALLALRALYERGHEWTAMKSNERSDRLILGT